MGIINKLKNNLVILNNNYSYYNHKNEITIKNDPNNYNYIVILGRQSQIVFFSIFLSVFNEINILCCVSVVKGFF